MRHVASFRRHVIGALAAAAGLLGWPALGAAQLLPLPDPTQVLADTATGTASTLTGSASAVQATVLGATTVLAGTGTLGGSTDARNASQLTGAVPSLLSSEVLQATTIGWPDRVASGASLANLAMSVGGIAVGADFLMAEAVATLSGGGVGTSYLDNLSINGVAVPVTGLPNQTVSIPGGLVVINEQTSSAGGIVVNALHVIVNGVADIALGSATAAIQ